MFLFYSLSAQFILVESFKKLKLKDARVQKPFKAHIGHLKMVRHATYHFVHRRRAEPREMFGQLNSAEELQDALGKHIREVVKHKAQVERFLEVRVKPRNWPT
jgi:F0F1-type ATP synthase delta subunit